METMKGAFGVEKNAGGREAEGVLGGASDDDRQSRLCFVRRRRFSTPRPFENETKTKTPKKKRSSHEPRRGRDGPLPGDGDDDRPPQAPLSGPDPAHASQPLDARARGAGRREGRGAGVAARRAGARREPGAAAVRLRSGEGPPGGREGAHAGGALPPGQVDGGEHRAVCLRG